MIELENGGIATRSFGVQHLPKKLYLLLLGVHVPKYIFVNNKLLNKEMQAQILENLACSICQKIYLLLPDAVMFPNICL